MIADNRIQIREDGTIVYVEAHGRLEAVTIVESNP